MEEAYKKIVEHIFSNWTGLQLAVEHSMGGPNSKQIAQDTVDYMVKYITTENGIEVEDIEDVLEDIMDQEFNTVCEDNSIKEISNLMYRFLLLIKQGNTTQCEIEFNNLPVGKNWLSSQSQPEPIDAQEPASTSSEENTNTQNETAMEEVEPEWTQVKSTRKKR